MPLIDLPETSQGSLCVMCERPARLISLDGEPVCYEDFTALLNVEAALRWQMALEAAKCKR